MHNINLTVQLQSTSSYWRFVSKCSFVLPRWQKVAGWFLDTKYQTCLLTQVMLVTMLVGMLNWSLDDVKIALKARF